MKKIPVYGIREFSKGSNEVYFYSNDLPNHLRSHQFINNPHSHSTYITILFTKGKGEHQIDFSSYPVKPGSVFLLNPGQVHCWKLSEQADGFVFFHTREFYDSIFTNRKITDFPFFYLQQNYPVIYLDKTEVVSVMSRFEEINQEFKANNSFKTEKLGSLIDLLYIELSRVYIKDSHDENKETSINYYKVKNLQRLIDEQFRTQKLPQQYADLMNMSTRHLNRLTREVLNKTTGDLIAERIILEAKRLLIHNDIPIANVGDQLGYDDVSYFIRVFKKHTGLSPKEFQKSTIKPFSL
ncbi:AraC family transcriptional regulator [Sporocytophaga myxococcoides]|uniref:AraC family transcriptional regulator n=1 Tax=Sporocytophaga myxococcoides TaxID=153721 RepID=A0A098LHC6_9BACT|nr:helix-turn-helix domain-containing protein [Sporocytophaga myxococcoides]GAL85844.1 AraC family transcriptional regulator [Sporocytophaga myxococcoides]